MFTVYVLRETQEVGVVLGEGGEGVVARVGLYLEGHVASLARGGMSTFHCFSRCFHVWGD